MTNLRDETQPPPGFEWGPEIDGVQTVVATDALLAVAMGLQFNFDGPKMKFTLRFSWELRDKLVAMLGVTP